MHLCKWGRFRFSFHPLFFLGCFPDSPQNCSRCSPCYIIVHHTKGFFIFEWILEKMAFFWFHPLGKPELHAPLPFLGKGSSVIWLMKIGIVIGIYGKERVIFYSSMTFTMVYFQTVLPLVGEFPYCRGKQGLVRSRENLRWHYAIVGESP